MTTLVVCIITFFMETKVTNWSAVANYISDALDYFEDEGIFVVLLRKDLECFYEKALFLAKESKSK